MPAFSFLLGCGLLDLHCWLSSHGCPAITACSLLKHKFMTELRKPSEPGWPDTNSLKIERNTGENRNGRSEAAFAKMPTPYLGHKQLKARFSSWERSGIFALTLCLAPDLWLKIHIQACTCPKPVVTLGPWKHKTFQKKPVS